jgi:hypothetical protein
MMNAPSSQVQTHLVLVGMILSVGSACAPSRQQTLSGQPPRLVPEEQLAAAAPLPEGFTPIFDGRSLTGWHASTRTVHGATPDFRILNGILVGTQDGNQEGGVLLTDRGYRDVEVFMDVKPDWGCDSGLFLRSSEAGEAYQVMMDYLPGGSMGGIYGEGLNGVIFEDEDRTRRAWAKAWHREEWNTVRARIEGDVPHIMVWVNDRLVTDFTDSANHAAHGAGDALIGIQVHRNDPGSMRWLPGGFWRWRTIAVKVLHRG